MTSTPPRSTRSLCALSRTRPSSPSSVMRAMRRWAQAAAAITVRGSSPSGNTICCGRAAARCLICSRISIGSDVQGQSRGSIDDLPFGLPPESNQLERREQVFASGQSHDNLKLRRFSFDRSIRNDVDTASTKPHEELASVRSEHSLALWSIDD